MKRAYLLIVTAVACWATGPVASKALLLASREGDRLNAVEVAFWGILVGWAVLLTALAVRGRLSAVWGFTGRGWAAAALIGVCGFVGYPVAINLAYVRLPLPEALVISSIAPVLVVLLQGRFFGSAVRLVSGWERPVEVGSAPSAPQVGVGLGLCLLGIAAVATKGDLATLQGIPLQGGTLAAVLAAVFWGVYSNLGRFVPVRPGFLAAGGADVQTLVGMTFGVAGLGAWLAVTGDLQLPTSYYTVLHLGGAGDAVVGAWVLIVLLGALNYGLGYTAWISGLEAGREQGGDHKLPALTYVTPVLAILLGWLLLREGLGGGFWKGAGLIAVGNLVILWGGRRGR